MTSFYPISAHSNGVEYHTFRPARKPVLPRRKSAYVVCVAKAAVMRKVSTYSCRHGTWYIALPQARLILVATALFHFFESKFMRIGGGTCIADSVEFAGSQKDVPAHCLVAQSPYYLRAGRAMPKRRVWRRWLCGLPCVLNRVSGSEELLNMAVNVCWSI